MCWCKFSAGKRPRDLLNPKAIKYMQSIFSIKDAISKKETREISALFGVTATQVRQHSLLLSTPFFCACVCVWTTCFVICIICLFISGRVLKVFSVLLWNCILCPIFPYLSSSYATAVENWEVLSVWSWCRSLDWCFYVVKLWLIFDYSFVL